MTMPEMTAEPIQENAADDLIQPLLALSKSTRQLISLKLSEIGVVAGQDQLLDAIDPHRPRGICEIARELSVRPSTVSKMLDSLERRGWCRREMDEADLRRTFVILTEDGARVRSEVRQVWSSLNDDLMRRLPSPDGSALSDALWRIERIVAGRLSRLR